MKLFQTISLLLTSTLLLSCSSARYFNTSDKQQVEILPPLNKYTTALYKASIQVGKRNFSGLLYFKKSKENNHRIIFLSELGLTFLEMEYRNNSFQVNKCQDFIDSKAILSTLKNDLKLVIDVPDNRAKINQHVDENRASRTVTFKSRGQTYFYLFNENDKLSKIIQKKRLKHLHIDFTNKSRAVPTQIEIEHKRIKLVITLKLLKVDVG